MRHPLKTAKRVVSDNKVGIAVVVSIITVYGGLAVMSYYGYKTTELRFEMAKLENQS